MSACKRCGNETDLLFEHYRAREDMTHLYEETGEPIPEQYREKVMLCRDCDWEVSNGYPMDSDPYEIEMDRAERNYYDDPINNDPPWVVLEKREDKVKEVDSEV